MTHETEHPAACLLLADGTVFSGVAIGANRLTMGELCFNTSMTGYQEILTDPSYAGQIITFTFPHIGNVGCNPEDFESQGVFASGLVLREVPTLPSNFRSAESLNDWLKSRDMAGIAAIDTRALTRHIRLKGAQNALIAPLPADESRMTELKAKLAAFPSMRGRELAAEVTGEKITDWRNTLWNLDSKLQTLNSESYHVVAIDYGAKHNILRHLAERGIRITVVPAATAAKDILALKPDGIFLSNGPGDPAATGAYALPIIRELIASKKPIFGICLGHQLLGLALGGKTEKMTQGHRGANHPVKDLESGKVIITSQNHGFVVSKDNLPEALEITHLSLFDDTIQGLQHKNLPIFCMQGHPEASPGPHDSAYLFDKFAELMKRGMHAEA